MRVRIILLTAVITLLMAEFSLADSGQAINLAVITDKSPSLDKSALVSMLEVELSQKDGINLLERVEIDKILEEQRLSAAGLQDRNSIMKIGQLLRADAFIMLSLESQVQDVNDLIRVRFAETAHGLRLMDYFEQSDSENPQESVENIVQELESVLKKISQPDEKLIPIGIVDIHRVELGEQYKMLERTLPTMLSVRLSLEPQIIMLEREDLKILLDEKLRTQGEDSDFWNSAILIDGYLQPNKGKLEMHLNLKHAGGTILKSLIIPVEPNEPTIAINTAVTEIVQNLNDSPPSGRWNPKLEAAQFYKQGQMLTNHKRNDEAIPVFETAYAIEPNNVYYTGALFGLIWNKGSDSGPYSDMEIANMASILVRQIRDNYKNGLLSTSYLDSHFRVSLGSYPSQGYFGKEQSVRTDVIKQINKENRKIWADTFEEALRKKIAESDFPQMMDYTRAASLFWIRSDEPNDLIINLNNTFKKYIMPPELGGCISSVSERKEIYEQSFLKYYNGPMERIVMFIGSHLKDSWDETKKLINGYLVKLAHSSDPIIGIQSKLQIYSDYQSFIKDLRTEFKTSKVNNSKYISEAIISLFPKISNIKIKEEETLSIFEEFCGYAIDNNDIDALTSLLSIGSNSPFVLVLNVINKKILTTNSQRYRLGKDKRYELCMRYNVLLEQIAGILEAENDNKKNAALVSLRSIQNDIKKEFSEELPIEPERSFNVTMILSQEDWPEEIKVFDIEGEFTRRWLHRNIQNEMLWIAMGLRSEKIIVSYIGLVGINLEQKKVVSLWQTKFEEIYGNQEISDLVINNQNIYIALDNKGIFVFPGSLKQGKKYFENPQILSQDDGLPSILITSIVQNPYKDSEKLWIAYGGNKKESGLGIYDLETKEWESVLCSTLNGEPPFNSGYTYDLYTLRFTKPGQLFFGVRTSDDEARKLEIWNDYWLMDTSTYKLTSIERAPSNSGNNSGYDIDVLRNSNIFDQSKITDRNILNGEYAETFLRTPYGLIAIGEGAVGLVEAKE